VTTSRSCLRSGSRVVEMTGTRIDESDRRPDDQSHQPLARWTARCQVAILSSTMAPGS